MPEQIKPEDFINNLFNLSDETFENHHGIYLDKDTVGGSLAIVVHTACHLGEIRQALCTLK